MNVTVNQDNLYLILPSKISLVAEMIADDENISIVEAIKRIYSSKTYQRLERESSKLWHVGPTSLFQEISDEQSSSEL